MMKIKILLTTAALIAVAAPAGGAVTVIGSSNARMCYEAADSKAMPSRGSLEPCNIALNGEARTEYDIVATHVNRGILRSRLGDMAGAMRDFDAALAIDPNQPEAYLNKGVVLIRQDNPDAALPLFTMALEKNTRRPALAYYGRGIAHEELGNIRSAYNDYKRAVEEDPEWKEPRKDLARFVIRR
jgi:tetratricopeptide (TPR) repeat protein